MAKRKTNKARMPMPGVVVQWCDHPLILQPEQSGDKSD